MSPDRLVSELGVSEAEANEGVSALLALNLLQADPNGGPELMPINPDSAATQLTGAMEQILMDQQRQVDRIRAELQAFTPLYLRSMESHTQRLEPVEVLSDLSAVRRTLQKFAADCTEELVTSQPGGRRRPAELVAARKLDADVLSRGVHMRTIYHHTSRYDQETYAYAEQNMAAGAEIRTSSVAFPRAIVYDRRIAVISLAAGSPSGALVVREEHMVAFILDSFERVWAVAEPLYAGRSREQLQLLSDSLNRSLLRMLANGMADEHIARKLGISVRTCQRRISEVMRVLNAKTRLQAGFLINQSGLLDDNGPD
ncbi:LuxR C-terminal-related transcriptional regulator [Streptomyces sp. NPDC058401]|uniref:helix-turn-helix transcriptional regulator n=1 Tax=Streptomyces sp. NPDC058401 TaxID=3346480 RepID=UPI00365BE05E